MRSLNGNDRTAPDDIPKHRFRKLCRVWINERLVKIGCLYAIIAEQADERMLAPLTVGCYVEPPNRELAQSLPRIPVFSHERYKLYVVLQEIIRRIAGFKACQPTCKPKAYGGLEGCKEGCTLSHEIPHTLTGRDCVRDLPIVILAILASDLSRSTLPNLPAFLRKPLPQLLLPLRTNTSRTKIASAAAA